MIHSEILDMTVYHCIMVISKEWKPFDWYPVSGVREEPEMIAQQTRTRVENPARWTKAAERALAEGIQVRQLQGSGQWIANSGSDASVAYELQITGNVAHGCDCLAGMNGDPVCKHRASFYLLIGALDLTPEPGGPAPVLTLDCPDCRGCGVVYGRELERAGLLYPACAACAGTGQIVAPVRVVPETIPAAVAA